MIAAWSRTMYVLTLMELIAAHMALQTSIAARNAAQGPTATLATIINATAAINASRKLSAEARLA